MKTSFEKFMNSTAVEEISKVELGAIKVELAAKDDLLKTIVAAQKLVTTATKVEGANNKLSAQYDDLIKKMPVAAQDSRMMAKQMSDIDVDLQSKLNKFNAQLKDMGIPLSSIPDVDSALKALKSSDFYSLINDLEFSAGYFGKIK
jgi:hypothetical protein